MYKLYILYFELVLSSFVCGFTTKRPFDILNDFLKSDNTDTTDFDLEYIEETLSNIDKNSDVNPHSDSPEPFQVNFKKSNFKPKYNPGWKFIGLGKRPLEKDGYDFNKNYLQRDVTQAFKKSYPNNQAPFHSDERHDGINPLLVSSILNFEIFSAIRDSIQEAARETTKKEFNDSRVVPVMDSTRQSGRYGLYSGRQKVTYDPGWMLTGLGK